MVVRKSLQNLAERLTTLAPAIPLESESEEDFALRTLLEEQGLRGGKRTRARLGELFCQALNIEAKAAQSFFHAVEMLHAATLIHDDVIDHSLTRRGRKTLHQIVGNRSAVLAGDYLLAKVIQKVASSRNTNAVQAISVCLEELVEGEWLQMELYENLFVTKSDLEKIATKKTGQLFAWTFAIPAFVQENASLEKTLWGFGKIFGLGFQMMDDILDFKESTGKPRLQDLRERRLNFVTQSIIEANPSLLKSWSWDPSSVAWSKDEEIAATRRIIDRIEGLSLGLQRMLIETIPNRSAARDEIQLLIQELSRRAS